ncbi:MULTISPECIES: hypothetical protein, partial [unclassified Bartonella]
NDLDYYSDEGSIDVENGRRMVTLVEGHYKQKYNKVNSLFVIILYESTQESTLLYVIHLTIFYIRLPCMNRSKKANHKEV